MRDYTKLKSVAVNGVIRAKDLERVGVARDYLRYAQEDGVIESVDRGVYVLISEMKDTLYVLQLKYGWAVFSAYTSAYLLNLTTRDVETIYISAPRNTNNHKLSKSNNVKIVREKTDELHELGIIKTKNSFGNEVTCHDAERTVCDFFNDKYLGDKFVQVEVLKNYLQSSNKNLAKLFDYAKQLGVLEELRKRVEVML